MGSEQIYICGIVIIGLFIVCSVICFVACSINRKKLNALFDKEYGTVQTTNRGKVK